MSDLKPCPFCGGEAKIRGIIGSMYVSCTSCFCDGPAPSATAAEAISEWNTRTDTISNPYGAKE